MIVAQSSLCSVATLPSGKTRGDRSLSESLSYPYQIGDIPNGCADIAIGLGLDPARALWDYEWVAPFGRGVKKEGLQEYQSVLPLIRGNAKGFTLRLYDGQLGYFQKYLGTTDVIEVTDQLPEDTADLLYPNHSVALQAAERAGGDPTIRSLFDGATYCACLPVGSVCSAVHSLGARTLITPEQTKLFNSKARVASQAEHYGYLFSPHVVVNSLEGLQKGFLEINKKVIALGLAPEETELWVKFDDLAGGDGVFHYVPGQTSFEDVQQWVHQTIDEMEADPSSLFPVVIDVHIGHLPDVRRIIGNFNVQAIVGEPGVTITGTTMQKTQNGIYLGGKMPETKEEKSFARTAYDFVAPVLGAARSQGYRGYAGIDVMGVERTDGTQVGYVIEMNGRMNSSTGTLSAVQWAQRQAGQGTLFAATSLTSSFRRVHDFLAFQTAFDGVLYKGRDSGYTGIFPAYLNFNRRSGISGAKVIALAPDQRSLEKLGERYQEIVRGMQPN